MTLLHHDPGNGEPAHFDWLVERAAPPDGVAPDAALDERSLRTLRVLERIDAPGCVAFEGNAAPDHRRLYLDFEGALSNGRGHVRRVARGSVYRLEERPALIVVVGAFEGAAPRCWTVELTTEGRVRGRAETVKADGATGYAWRA